MSTDSIEHLPDENEFNAGNNYKHIPNKIRIHNFGWNAGRSEFPWCCYGYIAIAILGIFVYGVFEVSYAYKFLQCMQFSADF